MNKLAQLAQDSWQRLSKKPWFIVFRGFFIGGIVSAVQARYSSGGLNLTLADAGHILTTAAIGAGIAVWHFYIDPNPVKGAPGSVSTISESTPKPN